MFTTRTMIIVSAIAAAGIVVLSQPSHSEQTVGVEHVKLQDRHPAFNVGDALRNALKAERSGENIPAPASTPKADRLNIVTDVNCSRFTWPNIPVGCLNGAVSSAQNGEVRTVSIDQREYKNVSVVTPGVQIVAQR